jgi:hypothetical protein
MDFFSKVFPDEELRGTRSVASPPSSQATCPTNISTSSLRLNGKSKTIELFEAAFGEYCCKLPTALLTQRRAAAGSALGELARTKSRRFAVLQEPGERAPERGRHEGAVRRRHIICRASTATPSSSDHSSAW